VLTARTRLQLVVDLGSGKGYLSDALAQGYSLRVLGIDSAASNTSGALSRQALVSRLMNLKRYGEMAASDGGARKRGVVQSQLDNGAGTVREGGSGTAGRAGSAAETGNSHVGAGMHGRGGGSSASAPEITAAGGVTRVAQGGVVAETMRDGDARGVCGVNGVVGVRGV